MIGVTGSAPDLRVAEEFFELFKTPWEPAVPTKRYAAVLSTNGVFEGFDADVVLLYSSREEIADRAAGATVERSDGPVDVQWREFTFPVYGSVALFDGRVSATAATCTGKAIDCWRQCSNRLVRRIGYDLFGEVDHLLTRGQPPSSALTPTLELHIAWLRSMLLESGVSFVEIPPRPAGYDFICCLTHDIDFFGIRRHKADRTLAGFVARASVGTLVDVVRRRRSLAEAARNWLALFSLPLVFLGLAHDFWHPFDDYARVENENRSTFFVVPFKGRPGIGPDGAVNPQRAVKYGAGEIQDELRLVAGRGSELAVHGIDAWRDADAGREELRQLSSVTGGKIAGIRMHWLYFRTDSPRELESAGFEYDSTWGYNEAVGYRAGTSQVFCLPTSKHLMELPLSIMDSALFLRGRMDLGRKEALQVCRRIVENATRFGGTLVVNWHDRSLAPERLWNRAYRELLAEIETDRTAWFATASEAVEWFRWRRSIRFENAFSADVRDIRVCASSAMDPACVIRIHRPDPQRGHVEDSPFDGR